MAEKINVEALINAFKFDGEIEKVTELHVGLINNTYRFDFRTAEGEAKPYLVQEINTYVFKDYDGLMNNVMGVTQHMQKKVSENGGDVSRECLCVQPTKEGKPYYLDSEGRCWRCYNFICGAHSYQTVETPDIFRRAASAFGTFQRLLADYPIDGLVETIPNFHNTVSRIADFKKAVADNLSGRADEVREEIDFILQREKDCSRLVDMLNEGKLPLRVTHNDTKLNNVMFDDETDESICVVDLDTVMPGLSLYDFGDSIRFGANTSDEDEKDISKVSVNLENFRAFTEGFLSTAGKVLTDEEINQLAFSSKLMTLECGMRFLGDYINGDIYFKTAYPEHNLVRARTQITLVADMEKHMDEMEAIVDSCRKNLGI